MKTAIAVLILIFLATTADAQVSFWTESATVKIRPLDSPGTVQSVTIKGALNEYESFQVAVRGTQSMTIHAGTLTLHNLILRP